MKHVLTVEIKKIINRITFVLFSRMYIDTWVILTVNVLNLIDITKQTKIILQLNSLKIILFISLEFIILL